MKHETPANTNSYVHIAKRFVIFVIVVELHKLL